MASLCNADMNNQIIRNNEWPKSINYFLLRLFAFSGNLMDRMDNDSNDLHWSFKNSVLNINHLWNQCLLYITHFFLPSSCISYHIFMSVMFCKYVILHNTCQFPKLVSFTIITLKINFFQVVWLTNMVEEIW